MLTRGGNDCCEYANESTHNQCPRSTQKIMKTTKTSKRLMGKKIRGGRYCLHRLNANNPLAKVAPAFLILYFTINFINHNNLQIMFEEPDPEPPSKPAPAPRKWHLPEDEIPGVQFEVRMIIFLNQL